MIMVFVRCEHRIGDFFNAITLTWSRGHGTTEDFILDMILVISAQVGGSRLKLMIGSLNVFIYHGNKKHF